jgi:Leucine-rich repeat (LRR) protein
MTIEHDVWITWQGEYAIGDEQKPMSVRLRFAADGAVDGDGEDEVGAFALRGVREDERLALTKAYATHEVAYEGVLDAEQGAIGGTWRLDEQSGAFALRRLTGTRRFAVSREQAERIREALAECGEWRLVVRTGVVWGPGERRTLLTALSLCEGGFDGMGLGLTLPVEHLEKHLDLSSLTDAGAEHVRVTSLDLQISKRVTSIDGLQSLPDLRSLEIRLLGLTSLDCLKSFTQLRFLDLSGCEVLADLSAVAALTQLQHLKLYGCKAVTELGGVENLTQLQFLDLSRCEQVSDLSPVAGLTQLQSLDLSGCNALKESLTDLSPLASLTQLQSLDLSYCEALTDLSPLAGLTQLHSLNLGDCKALTDLIPLAGLTHLQSLNLSECSALTDLIPLAGLNQLQSLKLNFCSALTDLSPLAGLTQLQSLSLRECSALTDLSPLAGLTQLQSLDLGSCMVLTDLSPLAGMTQLQSLDLGGCEGLTDLSPLAGLTQLQSLDLGSCMVLTDLSPLASLLQLQSLALSTCGALADLSPIASLPQLQSLNLGLCDALTDLSPIASLPQLQSLDLSWCEGLRHLPNLSSLDHLRKLELTHCSRLRSLEGIWGLPALAELEISNCPELSASSAWEPLTTLPALRKLGATLPAWFLARTLASAAAERGDVDLIVEEGASWIIAATDDPRRPGLLSAVGRAVAVLADVDEQTPQALAYLIGFAVAHDAADVAGLFEASARCASLAPVVEALESAVLQADAPLPPETLLALHTHCPHEPRLRDQTLRALARSLEDDAPPAAAPAWTARTAEAAARGLDVPSRYPCDRAVHEAVRDTLETRSAKGRFGPVDAWLFHALAAEHARNDRDDDPLLDWALATHQRLRTLALQAPRGPHRQQALSSLAAGLSRAADPAWGRERLDELLEAAAQLDPDTSELRAAVAEAHAVSGRWDDADRVAFDIRRDTVRDAALHRLDALVLASDREDRARRAVVYRAGLRRSEERTAQLEALAATEALAADPVAYGQLVALLVEHPQSQHRAVTAAVRRNPALGDAALPGQTVALTPREERLDADARSSERAAVLQGFEASGGLLAGLRALGASDELLARLGVSAG